MLRDNPVYVDGGIVRVRSHLCGVTPDEALDLAAQIVTAANEANKSEFEPGQAYIDADDFVMIRNFDNTGWYDKYGDFEDDDFATRPVRKLVPESKMEVNYIG